MLGYLILLFTLVPIIELALLIKVGQHIGLTNTITIVLLTGILGAILAKSQGLKVLGKMQRDMDMGLLPREPLFDGFMILCGGIMLLTPGLLTDAIGFLMLIPISRSLIKRWIQERIKKMMDEGRNITFTNYRQL